MAAANQNSTTPTASSTETITTSISAPSQSTSGSTPAGLPPSDPTQINTSITEWSNGTLTYLNGTLAKTNSPKSKGGLKNGAVGGLAVGMLIAGALLAALAFFLLFSRKNKHKATRAVSYEPTSYTEEHDLKHSTNTTSNPMGVTGAASIAENNLPQPKEDNAIIGDMSRIKSRIEGHVESYYHTAGPNNQMIAHALINALGSTFPVSMAKSQELLSNPRKRPAVLRAAIAWIIVSRIDFNSGPEETFLPAHFAGASRDLGASRMDEATRAALLSKWRQITAALSGSTFLQDMPASDSRLTNIGNALQVADGFLRPCAKDANHEKRLFNLEEIMKRAARFGFLLFSQPSSFQFDWTDDGSGLVVFPGLLQVSDDNGKPVTPPRALGQKETMPA